MGTVVPYLKKLEDEKYNGWDIEIYTQKIPENTNFYLAFCRRGEDFFRYELSTYDKKTFLEHLKVVLNNAEDYQYKKGYIHLK